MPARLTLHLPRRPVRVRYLTEGGRHLLGRDAACDVPIDDDRVSRRHAALAHDEAGWILADLGSKNGTFAEGRPVGDGAGLGSRAWLSIGGLLASFAVVDDVADDDAELRRRLDTTAALSRGLDPALGVERLLGRVLGSVLAVTGAERGFVLAAGDDGELAVAAARGIDGATLTDAAFAGSAGAVRRVLATRVPVAEADAFESTWLAEQASVVAEAIRAMVCVPLVAAERLMGVVYADSTQPGAAFTELDVRLLESLAGHAAVALAAAGLERELARLAASIAWSRVDAAHRSGDAA